MAPSKLGSLVLPSAQNRAFTVPVQVLIITLSSLLHKSFPSTPTGQQAQGAILAITLVSCHARDYKLLEMIMLGISVPVGVPISTAAAMPVLFDIRS